VSRTDVFARCCGLKDHALALAAVRFMLDHGYPGLHAPWPSLHGRVAVHFAVSVVGWRVE
jgi:hypothetical protein